MTKKRSSEIFMKISVLVPENEKRNFPNKYGKKFGGPRTETTFAKWSAIQKRLRTAVLEVLVDMKPVLCVTLEPISDLCRQY